MLHAAHVQDDALPPVAGPLYGVRGGRDPPRLHLVPAVPRVVAAPVEPPRHPQSSLPLSVRAVQVVVVAVVAGHDDGEEVVGVAEGRAVEVGLGGRVRGYGGHHGVRRDRHLQLVARLARRALLPERRLAHPLARPRRRELVV